jgi:hypothetical protein
MAFQLNMVTLWVLALVLLVVVMKVAIKVIRVLLGEVFDVRKLPEFVATDVLLDLGGLVVLALPTFLAPTELPEAFALLLNGLQALFVAVALAIAGKHIAKIRDYFPTVPADEASMVPSDRAASRSPTPPTDEPAGP